MMPRERTTRAAAVDFAALRRATPARLGVGRAGPHYTTRAWLKLRADHARAVDAVMTEVATGWAARSGLAEVRSRAGDRREFLLKPQLGRRLSPQDARKLRRIGSKLRAGRGAAAQRPRVLLCVGDGLSSAAVERNAGPLLRALTARLGAKHTLLPPLFVRNARVRIQDHIGEILRPDLICMLIGERPGLATAESLSAYVLFRPRLGSAEPDRTVVSNIHPAGLRIAAAAARLSALIDDAIRHRASGAGLARILAARS